MAFLAAREAENLRLFLPYVLKVASCIHEPVELMVVDLAEPLDNTQGVCEQFGVRYINQEWPYYGGAMKTSFKYATMDKIAIFDADGSIDIESLPKMLQVMNDGNDMVIGSRYAEGGSCVATKSAQLMSAVCNACFRIALGVKIRDCSTSYRIYRVADVKNLLLNSKNFDIMEEILCKLYLTKGKQYRVCEVPVHDVDRVEGSSRRSLLKFIYSLGRTLIKMVILRILAKNGYQPEKHERQAEALTKATIVCGAVVLIFIIAVTVKVLL